MMMRVQAWSIVLLAAVSAAPCFATDPAATGEARRLVEAADEAYAAGRVGEALALFERSMPYRPTAGALWGIAGCQLLLGHGDLAVAVLDRYLAVSTRYRNSRLMQDAVAAVAEAGQEIPGRSRRALLDRLQGAAAAVAAGSSPAAAGFEIRFGTGGGSTAAAGQRMAARQRGAALFQRGIEAVGEGDDTRALSSFERSMAYRRLRNSMYNMAICHLLLGHRDLAAACLDMYLDGRRNERDDPRVQAVRRALEESPEDLGSSERRALLWQGLDEGVGAPVRITAGGTGSRDVPEHLDRTLATIESSFHSTVGLNTTCFLMSVARLKNDYLMHPPSPQGPCQRAAVAHSLVMVYDEIDRRMTGAPLGRGGQSEIECLEWDPDDPLGGDLNGISPFGNYDAWNAIESEANRECPAAQTAPAPTRRRSGPLPTAVIRWEVVRMGSESLAIGAEPPLAVGSLVSLDGSASTDPSGGSLSFSWRMLGRPEGSRSEISVSPSVRQPGSRATFNVDREGTYSIELTVTTSSGQINGTRTRIWTGQDDEEEIPIAEVLQSLRLQCDENAFAWWFLRHYANCMRLNPHTVDPVGGTWRVPGATGSRTSVTFRQGVRPSDEAQLRELLDTGQQITIQNEDGIAFFGDARRGLQRTIDYWDTIRLADQDDDRASYRQRAEYQNFSRLMAFDPPRMNYHGRGVP